MSMHDRVAITDLINEFGHRMDAGDFDSLTDLVAEQAVYDVSALGGGLLIGAEGIRDAALALGDDNPVAHHVTNIVLQEQTDGVVRARSKGFGVMPDGSVGSVTYEDTVERTAAGWRISHRTVRPRRTPLQS